MSEPNIEILEKYADVLVNFALNDGQGVKEGDVVLLQVPECAKQILKPLRNAVLRAKANPIIQYLPDDISRDFFEIANDDQLTFFPEKYLKGKVEQMDHSISIISDVNKKELEGISPEKLMKRQQSFKPYIDWRDEKEDEGKFTWTLALYGTEEMAREVNMSLEEYWGEIITACYLDEENPVLKWKETFSEIERVKSKLNDLQIKDIHLTADKTDLRLSLGKNRIWKGGSGRNIPSFEIFTSPDWRSLNGFIQFTEPLYIFGNIITDVNLEFKDGKVVNFSATKGEDVLKEMISTENADKVGEFSLTDGRLSKITKFMAETLYDENVGGPNGNTHLALGKAYKDCYDGNPSDLSDSDWEELGFNESVIHTDIVATSNRKVIATLDSGEELVIYENGQFLI